ncbi:MAG: hypothetical protein EBQ92_09960 [Proteobacteria bacterium]|nr:hypothetical protein [Pseudomonadota bacterium]
MLEDSSSSVLQQEAITALSAIASSSDTNKAVVSSTLANSRFKGLGLNTLFKGLGLNTLLRVTIKHFFNFKQMFYIYMFCFNNSNLYILLKKN